LRGLKSVQGEWDWVTMAWNVERMFVLQPCEGQAVLVGRLRKIAYAFDSAVVAALTFDWAFRRPP
jgi:hypothetical protein